MGINDSGKKIKKEKTARRRSQEASSVDPKAKDLERPNRVMKEQKRCKRLCSSRMFDFPDDRYNLRQEEQAQHRKH